MNEKKLSPVVKQQYACPVIVVYGDIRSITQSINGTGASDNSIHPQKNKTKA